VARQPEDIRAHLRLAQAYAGKDRAAEAAWEYEEAVALRPEAIAAQTGLAAALGQLHLQSLAIRLLEERLRYQRGAVDLRRALADLSLEAGRPDRAATALAADGAGVLRSPEALLALGRAYLAMGRVREAQTTFEEDVRRWPQRAEGSYWLGRAAWIAGRSTAARQAWEHAAGVAPDDPRFPCCLGMSYVCDPAPGSVDRAGRAFDDALRRAPGYGPALLQVGLLFQRHGRYRDAAQRFLDTVDGAPNDPEPHRHLAAALSALGETTEAHRHRGLYYSLSAQPARALEEYERFQKACPDKIDGPLLISQSYIQMQQNERAAAVVDAALRHHPGEPVLLERLATLYILTHSLAEAGQIAAAWVRAHPDAPRAHWLLGRVARDSHRMDEAVREFEAALAREPNSAEYAADLGSALARNPAEAARQRALSLLRQAIRLSPREPEYHHQLGVLLQQSGQPEPARREFMATLSLDPDRSSDYNNLTQAAQALRRPRQVALWAAAMRAVQTRTSEEKRLYREAGERPHDPGRFCALAKTLLRSGKVVQAQSQLEQALQVWPGWPEARRLLAETTALRAVM
jgi:tetratricopeptide (TPR) repeat protein